MNTIWGIDLGGTKIEGVVLSHPSPEFVIARRRIDTEAQHGYRHIVSQIKKLIELLEAETGIKASKVGIATPGTHDPTTNLMKGCNTTCLNGQPLKADLTKTLGIPVALANDANCFALAEATMGIVPSVVPDFKCVFGIIMGTGVGGGLVFRGNDNQPFVLNGMQGIAGEWGHNVIEFGGYDCFCGKKGCLEQVVSGPALQRYYFEQSDIHHQLVDIVALHQKGTDIHATATINRLLDYFAQAVSTIANVLDPDAIVVGGGVGNIDLLYTEGVERVKKYIFNEGRFANRVLKPKLGDSAGVFGAAML
jgi:fructokinase